MGGGFRFWVQKFGRIADFFYSDCHPTQFLLFVRPTVFGGFPYTAHGAQITPFSPLFFIFVFMLILG